MRTFHILIIVPSLILSACNAKEAVNTRKVAFGVYETILVKDLPTALLDTLEKSSITLEKEFQLPIIGYIADTDSGILRFNFVVESIKIVRTAFKVDQEGKCQALIAVKNKPFIDNFDVQKAKYTDNSVEVYFNMKGAKKWAEMTRNNKGRMVAFMIDEEVYSLPFINDEIRAGIASISGLKDESTAKSISDALNTK